MDRPLASAEINEAAAASRAGEKQTLDWPERKLGSPYLWRCKVTSAARQASHDLLALVPDYRLS